MWNPAFKGLYALGRLPVGEQNKTEQAFDHYLAMQKLAGEILWYKFSGIKLRLADNTFVTVDFFVLTKDREIQAIDTKGSPRIYMDDAKVKMKAAAEAYPIFRFRVAFPKAKKDGGGWDLVEV